MGDRGRSRDELLAEVEALREAESRLRAIAEHASDVIAEADAAGRLLFISPNCEALIGRPPSEFVGLDPRDPAIVGHLHPDDVEQAFPPGPPPSADPEARVLIYRCRHADGRWLWIESRVRPFQTPSGEWHSIVVSRDVTAREEALRRLRQSEERYRALTETTSDAVAELDAEGRLVFASGSLAQVLGYTPGELVGTTPFGLIHPDDVETLAERFLSRVSESRPRGKGQVFRVRHRNGSWRWLRGGGINIETASGETRLVAVFSDVTEQIELEEARRKLDERVQEMQKLESLGVMAGGVAHDFNNLLTPILGDASLALMELPQGSAVRRRIERIQRAAHHAATLTHQLLDYAGIGSLDLEPVDVSKLVREMGELLQSAVSKHADLVYELADDLPAVRADPRLLSQVVVNLLTNASEAVDARPGGGGRIAVRSGSAEFRSERLAQMVLGEEVSPGRHVFFEVEDAGCGMDADMRARIFDPFFTTKFTGRGLGLAAVLGIVRKHRGAIEIESEPGRGTRIRVLCPATAGEETARPAARRELDAWESSGTVLVADDDDGARAILQETLARAGFRVLEAGDGREAVETFRRHADAIRLVLLDRTMPVASGEEALDAIRRISPQVPIVLVSGYSRESAASQLANDEHSAFLQKPFPPETLIEKVRDLLSG
jgi:two-component system cell cycle sensor histidine kinase/response regulator CckA